MIMETIAFVFIFLLGTIIGSFLNVVIYRFNTGKTLVKGGSICMTCNKKLCWYELIPVFSFLIQSGKCRKCASNISHQYPIVELATGLLFALLAVHFLPILLISQFKFIFLMSIYAFVFSLLMVIVVYDIRHKIIPDKLVYAFILISFSLLFIDSTGLNSIFVLPTFMNVLAGPILASPFALLWLVSRGAWMGLGDAKLVLGIGWMLGLSTALTAVTLSFWIGAIVSVSLLLLSSKKMNMKTEVPFAPFLIIGTLVAFLYNIDIFSLASIFN